VEEATDTSLLRPSSAVPASRERGETEEVSVAVGSGLAATRSRSMRSLPLSREDRAEIRRLERKQEKARAKQGLKSMAQVGVLLSRNVALLLLNLACMCACTVS
jgi:hypothetical protein